MAAPAASHVLAGSFALLALVPLTVFRATALTIAIGLLIDAFLVRQLLVPALITLIGRRTRLENRLLARRRST